MALRCSGGCASPPHLQRLGNREGETEARRERRAQGPGSPDSPQVEVAPGGSSLRTHPHLGRLSPSLSPAPSGPGWAAERGSGRLEGAQGAGAGAGARPGGAGTGAPRQASAAAELYKAARRGAESRAALCKNSAHVCARPAPPRPARPPASQSLRATPDPMAFSLVRAARAGRGRAGPLSPAASANGPRAVLPPQAPPPSTAAPGERPTGGAPVTCPRSWASWSGVGRRRGGGRELSS